MPQMTDTLVAKSRSNHGKGAARKLRAAKSIPAVAYGPAVGTEYLALDPHAFQMQRAQYGGNHIFEVAVEGGKTFKALIREVQVDPVSQKLLHVDLYALDMTKPIRVEIPVELHGKPVGFLEGGILQHTLRKVLVECLPSNIPTKLTADVSHLALNQSLHASEIKLPDGVKLIMAHDEAVASVVSPEQEVAAAAATDAAGAAPAAGAAAAKDGGKDAAKEGKK